MSFISLSFAIFFIVVSVLFRTFQKFLPENKAAPVNQCVLLAASLFFYGWANAAFLPILLYVCAVTFIFGFVPKKKIFLIIFLILDSIPLLVFKYTDFFISSFTDFKFNFILPLGISFFTFQSISYVVECYKGTIEPEKNPVVVFLYVSFFPVISSGPIQQPENLIPQFKKTLPFNYDQVTDGMKLFIWGFFKKVFIADSLAVYVNYVYSTTDNFGSAYLIATIFYSFQLYCDFSGYSDMAIGIGKFLGFEFGENFHHPYLADSVGNFWHRWHISLSTWLKDYIYIPCGGSRVPLPRIYLNLFITFLVSGIWHGAAWTFIIWGLLHGFFQCIERLTRNTRLVKKTPVWVKIVITFILVSFAWIFFRSDSLESALVIVKKIILIPAELKNVFPNLVREKGLFEAIKQYLVLVESVHGIVPMAKRFLMILFISAIDILCEKKSGLERIRQCPVYIRWLLYYGLLFFVIFNCLNGDLSSNFIYNNF